MPHPKGDIMIKKLIIAISILLLATPLMAQDTSLDALQVAELLASPMGRFNKVSDSVAISVWYNGQNTAIFGVSASTGDFNFQEDGVAVTTIPQLTGGLLDVSEASGDTAGEVADLINFDSSSTWHAFVGPDATRGTVLTAGILIPITPATPSRLEGSPIEVFIDAQQADYISCGVRGDEAARNRISRVDYSGFASNSTGMLEIWSDSRQIHGRHYEFANNVNYILTTVSPDSVDFELPGLGADYGEGIVAFLRADANANSLHSIPTQPATGNVSIIYNVFKN